MPPEAPTSAASDANSVLARLSAILAVFDPEHPELSLSQLVARTGLPKSTVYRMAENLVTFGWLERVSSRYRPGIRVFELSGMVRERRVLRELALPFLENLFVAIHEVVHLGTLHNLDVLYVERIGGHRCVKVPTRVGGREPAYCTGLGKAMLAFSDPTVVDGVIARGLRPRTPYTIVVPAVLRQALAETCRTGVAFDREESGLGWSCVAAPIFQRSTLLAAVSVTGAACRLDLDQVAPHVRQAALGISRALTGARAS